MSTDVGEKSYLSHTAQEIDDAIDALPSKAAASDLTAEVTARQQLQAAVSVLINGGSKNRATVNDTSGTRNVVIPVNLPAGDWVIYFGEIASDDTDATVCRVALADSTDTAVWSGGTTRGTDKSVSVVIDSAAASLYVYASDNYNHSSGDTVTVSNLMVCTKAEWDISQTYVPYCPTMPELYQMILDLGGGSRAAAVQLAPAGEEEQR
jgi:hypothetical protein